jgi:hypothetical protein
VRLAKSTPSQPRVPILAHSAAPHETNGAEALYVPGSERLQHFVDAAAIAGLGPDDAIRLGVERGLVLLDLGRLGRGLNGTRRLLRTAAQEARPEMALAPATAAWVRLLSMARPVPAANVGEGIVVRLPDRLLCRASDGLDARSLRAEVVAEMVAWERAAALNGRTMGEWALSLSGRR